MWLEMRISLMCSEILKNRIDKFWVKINNYSNKKKPSSFFSYSWLRNKEESGRSGAIFSNGAYINYNQYWSSRSRKRIESSRAPASSTTQPKRKAEISSCQSLMLNKYRDEAKPRPFNRKLHFIATFDKMSWEVEVFFYLKQLLLSARRSWQTKSNQ